MDSVFSGSSDASLVISVYPAHFSRLRNLKKWLSPTSLSLKLTSHWLGLLLLAAEVIL